MCSCLNVTKWNVICLEISKQILLGFILLQLSAVEIDNIPSITALYCFQIIFIEAKEKLQEAMKAHNIQGDRVAYLNKQ